MTKVYKILSRTEWDAAVAAGRFEGSALDRADGYIHLSAADQAQETADKWFAGQADLLLVTLDAEALGPALKWEESRGGALFPHLYRPLATTEALAIQPLALGTNGAPALGELSA